MVYGRAVELAHEVEFADAFGGNGKRSIDGHFADLCGAAKPGNFFRCLDRSNPLKKGGGSDERYIGQCITKLVEALDGYRDLIDTELAALQPIVANGRNEGLDRAGIFR